MAVSLLFAGHMIDAPDRAEPRFAASMEAAARSRISQAIAPYAPGQNPSGEPVMGFAGGARGGDILFHEQCRALGIDTVMVLPFVPDVFVSTSVAGTPEGRWVQRFWRLWDSSPDDRREVLDVAATEDAYGACNTRLLERARAYGNVHLIALWDGKTGDGPGGTADLVARVRPASTPDIFTPESLKTIKTPPRT